MVVKEMFNEIDKESDGEIYYREMVSHLDSLNNDLDQENNPQVNLVAKLSDLTGLAKDKNNSICIPQDFCNLNLNSTSVRTHMYSYLHLPYSTRKGTVFRDV